MTEQTEQKKRRDRSPSYPAIPLSVAVDKVRELYRHEKAYLTPIDTVFEHWNYRPRSGSGAVAVAAALKFGLVEDDGSGPNRRVKVSELGLRIVRDTREVSPERERLLREAALLPALHRELWEKYGGSLPSDANLKHALKFEYGFTDVGAGEFAREFRATITFAGLEGAEEEERLDPADYSAPTDQVPTAGRSMPVPEIAERSRITDAGRQASMRPAAPTAPIVLPLPIAGTDPARWPSLHLYERLPEADWQLMLNVLNAMKPAIISVAEEQAAERVSPGGQRPDVPEPEGPDPMGGTE